MCGAGERPQGLAELSLPSLVPSFLPCSRSTSPASSTSHSLPPSDDSSALAPRSPHPRRPSPGVLGAFPSPRGLVFLFCVCG